MNSGPTIMASLCIDTHRACDSRSEGLGFASCTGNVSVDIHHWCQTGLSTTWWCAKYTRSIGSCSRRGDYVLLLASTVFRRYVHTSNEQRR